MKKRNVSGVLMVMLLLIVCLSVPGSVCSQEKAIELSFSNFLPAEYHITKALMEWSQEIEKRAGRKVKITMHHSGTLTSATANYEGVIRGLSDIGHSCLAYTRGRFPLMEVVDLPGYPFNAIITSRVAHDVYKKFKPKELEDTHVLFIHAHIPGGIYTRAKPAKTLEDLKGQRIRCTGLSANIIKALGGTPVAMPKGDQYEALQRGLVDGTVGPPNEVKGYRVAEVAKYLTMYPHAGYVTAMYVVMNLKKWNSLPPDVQKIFTEVSEKWVEHTGKAWNEGEIEGIKMGKQVGLNFIFLPANEAARWDKALQPLFEDYLKSMQGKGLSGKEVLDYRNTLINQYGKIYPPLKFD
jgi:TRAP-type C4-dicarboxylate transport system substrate-binding protein